MKHIVEDDQSAGAQQTEGSLIMSIVIWLVRIYKNQAEAFGTLGIFGLLEYVASVSSPHFDYRGNAGTLDLINASARLRFAVTKEVLVEDTWTIDYAE